MNNYQVISDTVELMLNKRYKVIEKYLENIINSPSTINRIVKYYHIVFSEDYTMVYLLFKDTIIRRYGITRKDYYDELKIEMWCEMGLNIQVPVPIMYIPK